MMKEPVSQTFKDAIQEAADYRPTIDENVVVHGYGVCSPQTCQHEANKAASMAHEMAAAGNHGGAAYHHERAAMFHKALQAHLATQPQHQSTTGGHRGDLGSTSARNDNRVKHAIEKGMTGIGVTPLKEAVTSPTRMDLQRTLEAHMTSHPGATFHQHINHVEKTHNVRNVQLTGKAGNMRSLGKWVVTHFEPLKEEQIPDHLKHFVSAGNGDHIGMVHPGVYEPHKWYAEHTKTGLLPGVYGSREEAVQALRDHHVGLKEEHIPGYVVSETIPSQGSIAKHLARQKHGDAVAVGREGRRVHIQHHNQGEKKWEVRCETGFHPTIHYTPDSAARAAYRRAREINEAVVPGGINANPDDRIVRGGYQDPAYNMPGTPTLGRVQAKLVKGRQETVAEGTGRATYMCPSCQKVYNQERRHGSSHNEAMEAASHDHDLKHTSLYPMGTRNPHQETK